MIRAGIVGGTGYAGAELLRLMLGHPGFELAYITSRQDAGRPLSVQWPQLAGIEGLTFSAPEREVLADCDIAFFATPHRTAMTMAAPLLDAGVRVVDLSADFRLASIEEWESAYDVRHESPELIERSVYGLPEVNREAIREAELVACPGCYPTAVLLGLLPVVEGRAAEHGSLIADAKSGVSGAGRKAVTGTLFGEVHENFRAYGVAGHRHLPEIRQELSKAAGEDVPLTFIPHLVPMFRGLQATLYATLKPDVELSSADYASRYEAHPFVHVHPEGTIPETRAARGTNDCHIALHWLPEVRRLVVVSVIDNLVKGAAGQAVQCANLMTGQSETAGLETPPFFP